MKSVYLFICFVCQLNFLPLPKLLVIITTAQLDSTKPKRRFCTGSNPARDVSKNCDCEDLWQWSWLEIRLNTFRRSTIPQKQSSSSANVKLCISHQRKPYSNENTICVIPDQITQYFLGSHGDHLRFCWNLAEMNLSVTEINPENFSFLS